MPIETYRTFNPVVAPTAWVHGSAWLIGDVELGADVSIWPTCVLRGDNGKITIGARTNVQDGTVVHATVGVSTTTVGASCTIGHRVTLHGCQVGDRCLIGMGSTVLDNAVIGDDSFLAAGSLVAPGRKFEPRSFLLGSPARRIREVNARELEAIAHGERVYLGLLREYRGLR